jgi:hypothetical protein
MTQKLLNLVREQRKCWKMFRDRYVKESLVSMFSKIRLIIGLNYYFSMLVELLIIEHVSIIEHLKIFFSLL